MSTNYLYPIITVGPNSVYSVVLDLPALDLAMLIEGRDADVEIVRKIVGRGTVFNETRHVARLRDRSWVDTTGFRFLAAADARFDWRDPDNLSFVETSISLSGDATFQAPDRLPFYSSYIAANEKGFFSDNALKYGDRNVIALFTEFQTLLTSYPTCRIDLSRDMTESVLLMNPYLSETLAYIEAEGTGRRVPVRVPALSGRRLDIAEFLPDGAPWWGTVFVSSVARPISLFCKHSHRDPNIVTQLEHNLAYYSSRVEVPFTRKARLWFGRRVIKRLRHRRQRAAVLAATIDDTTHS
jgi:hypothetical protein